VNWDDIKVNDILILIVCKSTHSRHSGFIVTAMKFVWRIIRGKFSSLTTFLLWPLRLHSSKSEGVHPNQKDLDLHKNWPMIIICR
jgi:hypothetical protein